MMTVNDLFDHFIQEHYLLPENLSADTFSWITSYYSNRSHIDDFFKRQYGDYRLIFDVNSYNEWKAFVLDTLYINAVNLDHLWKMTQVKYSPIENVVEHSERDITDDEKTNSDTSGQRVDVDNIGTNGKTGDVDNHTTLHTVPYDLDEERETDAGYNFTTNHELETTRTTGAQTDIHSIGQAHSKEIYDRHANVGVTSNVQLLEQEQRFWGSEFNFFISLFKLLKREWLNGCLS